MVADRLDVGFIRNPIRIPQRFEHVGRVILEFTFLELFLQNRLELDFVANREVELRRDELLVGRDEADGLVDARDQRGDDVPLLVVEEDLPLVGALPRGRAVVVADLVLVGPRVFVRRPLLALCLAVL